MHKRWIVISTFLLIASLFLGACSTGNASGIDLEVNQTLVALALTQTAVAESTEPPSEPMAETPTEAVAEAAAEEPTPAEHTPTIAPIVHNQTPGEPGYISRWFNDTNSSSNAGAKSVSGGDDFVANLFERPFTAEDMVYRPYLDITRAEITSDNTFIYVNILVDGESPEGGLPANYGVEVDWDRNGRGDLLVTAQSPTPGQWDIAGVRVFKDSNHDVGGSSIMRPDSAYGGNSYETVLFSTDVLEDPDLAWARWTSGSSPTVTIAFKKSLIESGGTFVWGVWAADSLLDPAMLDLHDHFTQTEAGSPYASHASYPIATIAQVDNTCRETYGFDAASPIPGLCYVPKVEPTLAPTTPAVGTITGSVFYDDNRNGSRDSGESAFTYGITITLHADSCSNPAISTTSDYNFAFSDLAAGSYCVKATNDGGSISTTPTQFNVVVTPGGAIYVEFGFFVLG